MSYPPSRQSFPPGKCPGSGNHVFCNFLLSNILDRDEISKDKDAQTSVSLRAEMRGTLITGSKAELLRLRINLLEKPKDSSEGIMKQVMYNSDFDYMECLAIISELQHISNPSEISSDVDLSFTLEELNLILVTSDALRPGYCFVCATDPPYDKQGKLVFLTHACLSTVEQLLRSSSSASSTHVPDGKMHDSYDYILCFSSQFWPENTTDVFNRRHNVWPSHQLLKDIRKTCRLLIVRKAHPLDGYLNREFRFSFSLLEVMLSRSLPDEVRHVYLTVKLLCKYYAPLTNTQLKSYYLKTILYWIASREDITTWHNGSFGHNIYLFLHELREAFKQSKISNFFIPAANLIEHLDYEECLQISSAVNDLHDSLCAIVLRLSRDYSMVYMTSDADLFYHAREYFRKSKRRKDPQQAELEAHEARKLYLRNTPFPEKNLQVYTLWLVEYGLVLWELRDEVGAFVSWLNALVLLFTPGAKALNMNSILDSASDSVLSRPNYVSYINRSMNSFNEMKFYSGMYSLPLQTLYFAVTKLLLPPSSVTHLTQQTTRLNLIYKDSLPDFAVPRLISGNNWIFHYCSQFYTNKRSLDNEVAKIRQQFILVKARDNVYGVCSAVCEYLQQYRPCPPPPSRPRHSFSGVSATCRYHETLGTTARSRYTPDSFLSLSTAEADMLQQTFSHLYIASSSGVFPEPASPHNHLRPLHRRHSFSGTSVTDHRYFISDFGALGPFLANFGVTKNRLKASLKTKFYIAFMTEYMLNPTEPTKAEGIRIIAQGKGVEQVVEGLNECMKQAEAADKSWDAWYAHTICEMGNEFG